MKPRKRELLKGMALGAAWTTPVVQSITSPAHAQASQCSITVEGSVTGTTTYQILIWICPVTDDTGDCYVYRTSFGDGSSSDSATQDLPPGTYYAGYFSAGPSATGSYSVRCCEQEVGESGFPTGGNIAPCFGHTVVINADGSCAISDGPCLE